MFSNNENKFSFFFHSLRYTNNKHNNEFTLVYKLSDFIYKENTKLVEIIKNISEMNNSEVIIPSVALIIRTDSKEVFLMEEILNLWDVSYKLNCVVYEKNNMAYQIWSLQEFNG